MHSAALDSQFWCSLIILYNITIITYKLYAHNNPLLSPLSPLSPLSTYRCTFVENDLTDATFFSTPCRLGPNGVEEVLPFGTLSKAEQTVFDAMLPDLMAQAKKGFDYATK